MNPLASTLPLFALAVAAILVLLFFFRRNPDGRSPASGVALAGCLVAAFWAWLKWPAPEVSEHGFDGFLLADSVGFLVVFVSALAGAVTAIFLPPYALKAGRERAEIYALLLFAVLGMAVMAMTDHLVTLFIGLETFSLALYCLSASMRERATSIEAGLKYFLTGAFASGILVFGVALLFGATGALDLPAVATKIKAGDALALTGSLLLLVGFAFKLSAAPFHMWAPDVYEGAPTPITGFMSTTVKLVAFVALMRVVKAFGALDDKIADALAWIVALTVAVGNLGALAQTSVKRMLAYSSISHAGFILAAVACLAAATHSGSKGLAIDAQQAVLFYLIAYTLMNLGAFGVLSALETAEGKGLNFADLGGLKERHPKLALALLFFMLSLAGVPPTAGFLAKWEVFSALVGQYRATGDRSYFVLIVFLALGSVVGLAYYLKVIVAAYMSPAPNAPATHPAPPRATVAAILVCAVLVLWLGVAPSSFLFAPDSVLGFFRQISG